MTSSTPEDKLLNAARIGSIEIIRSEIVDKNANIDYPYDFGETALHVAVRNNHPQCVQLLIQLHASVHTRDKVGNKPIHTAANYGNQQCIAMLLEKNKDLVFSTNKRRETPLHLAVRNGHQKCVQTLLECGAPVDALDSINNTPLHTAIAYGNSSCIKVLLEHNASVLSINRAGELPLEAAAHLPTDENIELLENYQFKALFSDMKSLGADTVHEFKDMLSKGSYKCYWNRIYLAGPYNVGKTTLAKNLVGDDIPQVREATDGIWICIGRAGMNTKERKWVCLPQGTVLSAAIQSLLMSFDDSGDIDHILNKPDAQVEKQVPCEEPTEFQTHNPDFEEDSNAALDHVTHSTRNYKDLSKLISENKTTAKRPIQHLPAAILSSKHQDLRKSRTQMTNEEILNLVLKACKKGGYRSTIIPIDLWDFGGQKIYYMTHQLFISSRGTFVIVFNGSVDIYEELSELSFLPGQQGKRTVAVYLMHWVNSILTYCQTSKTGFPRILFVATHKDLVSKNKREKRRRKLMDEIIKLFANHSGKSHLQLIPLFFVDARDPLDEDVLALQKTLVDVAVAHPRWGDLMPTLCIPLELQLSEMVKDGIKILHIDELQKINASNKEMALSDSQLQAFLKVQHSLGRCIYFQDSRLKNYVVIDPTFLIEVLRSVVTEEQFWPKDDSTLVKIFLTLKESGKIHRDDLWKLWTQVQFIHIIEFKEYMTDMLVFLDILVKPRSVTFADADDNEDVGNNEIFLVPCMISKAGPKQRSCNRSIYLAYKFIEDIIPPAFLYHFLGAFISMWELKYMFTDSAQVVIDTNHELTIYVERNRLVVKVTHRNNKKRIVPTIASTVQECLTRSMYAISKFYWATTESEPCLYEKTDASFSDTMKRVHSTAAKKYSSEQIRDIPYTIEFGSNCGSKICFFQNSLTTEGPKLRCEQCKNLHDTSDLNIWFTEKSLQYARKEQNLLVCNENCPGIGDLELQQCPSDKQIGRLVAVLEVVDVYNLNFELGLSFTKWDELKYEHIHAWDLKFFALVEWKRSSNLPTFQKLKDALEEIGIDHHLLCQVFREKATPACKETSMSYQPNSRFFENLANNIGTDAMQLGAELGIKGVDLQEIAARYKTRLMEQTREILRRCKRQKLSIYVIAKGMYRIGKEMVFDYCFSYEK